MATTPFNTVYAPAVYRSQLPPTYVSPTPTQTHPPPSQNPYYLTHLNDNSPSHHSQVLLQPSQGGSQAASHNISNNGTQLQQQPQNPTWGSLNDKRIPQGLGFGNGSGHGMLPFNGFHSSPSSASLPMNLHSDEKIKSLPQRSLTDAQMHASQAMNMASSMNSSQVPQDLPTAILPAQQPRTGCRSLATTKRAAQNRAAQRAFRQRKDKYIKDLEVKAKELEAIKRRLDQAEKEKDEMRSTIAGLRTEVAKLKGEVEDDKSRGGNSSNSSSNINSPFTPNGTSEDDLIGEDPWMRKSKKSSSTYYGERTSPTYPAPQSRSSISSVADPVRPSTGICNPINTSDSSSTNPSNAHFDASRNEYRSYSASPTSDSRRSFSSCVSSAQPRTSVSEDDPSERMMDDLCEMLKTRSHPEVHPGVGAFWSRNTPVVAAGNGSNAAVVG